MGYLSLLLGIRWALQRLICLHHAAHKTAQLLGAEACAGRFDHQLDAFGNVQVAAYLERTRATSSVWYGGGPALE